MIHVGLVQINVDFQSEYLPYSVGLLQAYARQSLAIEAQYVFEPMVFRRDPDLDATVARLAPARIVAFSAYVWNTNYSLELARRIKVARPDTLIVFGGPHVPDDSEGFLRAHPWVDITIHGEGEEAFRELLLRYPEGAHWTAPSVRYLDRERNVFVSNPKAARIADLEQIPSPYLMGLFDDLMNGDPEATWNAIWETNRGCPFSCTYCDWGSATQGKLHQRPLGVLKEEIAWFGQHRVEYLMCADANFGILARDLDIAKMLAGQKATTGFPGVLAATFTKNATERSYAIARVLMDADLIRGYTVSTQSVDEATLRAIRRNNISQASFTELQARFNRDHLPTYTDLIMGLPGETYTSFARGIEAVIRRGQYHKVYFLILSVLPNAQMADPAYRAAHGIQTVTVPQVNLHESVRALEGEIVETQELVVATTAMPPEDWCRTVALAWMTSLVYFDKLLHVPLTCLFHLSGQSIVSFLEAFLFQAVDERYPLISRLSVGFLAKARRIQQEGEVEHSQAPGWLDIWWQPDKVAFMEVCRDLDAFYGEAGPLLEGILQREGRPDLVPLLADALLLNRAMVRTPFLERPIRVETRTNVLECYQGILAQEAVTMQAGGYAYEILGPDEPWESVETWCRRVVWFGNKTSAYLRPARSLGAEAIPEGAVPFREGVNKPYCFS